MVYHWAKKHLKHLGIKNGRALEKERLKAMTQENCRPFFWKLWDFLSTHSVHNGLLFNMDETMVDMGSGKLRVFVSADRFSEKAFTATETNSAEHLTMTVCISYQGIEGALYVTEYDCVASTLHQATWSFQL